MMSSSRALPLAHENHQECRANRRGSRFHDDASQALECRRRPPQEKRGFHLETQDQEWELSGGTSMTPQRMAPTGVIIAGTRPAGQGFHPGQPLLPSRTLPKQSFEPVLNHPLQKQAPLAARVELETLETKHEQAGDARHTKDTLDMEINTMKNAKRNKPAGGHLLPRSNGYQMLRRGRGRCQVQG
jgi:hypothetical protein